MGFFNLNAPRILPRVFWACVLLPLAILLNGCGRKQPVTTSTTTTTTTSTTTTTTTTSTNSRWGSFLAVGDWGWDPVVYGDLNSAECQQAVADKMHRTFVQLGDVKFIINVGDSFYPRGVNSKQDPQWEKKWRTIYSKELRSVPWYTVYGDRDLLSDPCACSDDCAQVNDDPLNRSFFYMPNMSYHVEHPELRTEVVGLDSTFLWATATCSLTPCPKKCEKNLKRRMEEAYDLFAQRFEESEAQHLVIFSHYPTDYFWANNDFLGKLRNNTNRNIVYFGGHRHNVDTRSCLSIAPNSAWLTGGGGGWGCEGYGTEQGFVVGQMLRDGKMLTYPELVEWGLCCR